MDRSTALKELQAVVQTIFVNESKINEIDNQVERLKNNRVSLFEEKQTLADQKEVALKNLDAALLLPPSVGNVLATGQGGTKRLDITHVGAPLTPITHSTSVKRNNRRVSVWSLLRRIGSRRAIRI